MRRRAIALTAAAGLAVGAVPAHSAWKATGQVTLAAQSSTLAAPGAVTGAATATDKATISWQAAAPMPTGTVRYFVERTGFQPTSGWVAACGTSISAPISGLECTDTDLSAATDYQYRVTAVYAKWLRPGSPSGRVTTAAAPLSTAAVGLGFDVCSTTTPLVVARDTTHPVTLHLLDAQGGRGATSRTPVEVRLAVSNGNAGGVSPASATIQPGASTLQVAIARRSNSASFTITASSDGLTAATCSVK